MPAQYSLDAPFELDGMSVWAVNIIFAPFLQAMPAHSHGTGCYEIHFIPAGRGTLQTAHATYATGPDALFVPGPHVLHAQLPDAENPMQEYCVYLRVEHRGKTPSPVARAFCGTPAASNAAATACLLRPSVFAIELTAVFRRCANAARTTRKKNGSSATSTGGVLRMHRRITAESTFGAGMKLPRLT